MKKWISQSAVGFFIGVANLIPGVSGGTFALIFGVYTRLLAAVGQYNTHYAAQLWRMLYRREFRSFFALLLNDNARFLLRIALPAAAAVLIFSRLITFLLHHYYETTYAFFCGLIIVSIAVPLRMIQEKRPVYLLLFLAGVLVTVALAFNVDPSVKTLAKSEQYQLILQGGGTAVPVSLLRQAGVLVAGMIAVSAMVLPGVSGSFVLLLLGKYETIISAASRLGMFAPEDLITLAVFAAGCLIGIAVFVRLFNTVYRRAPGFTLAFLVGLMAGSLYALWPYKETITADIYDKTDKGIQLIEGVVLYTNRPYLPSAAWEWWPVVLSFLLGAAVMGVFVFFDYRKKGKGVTGS